MATILAAAIGLIGAVAIAAVGWRGRIADRRRKHAHDTLSTAAGVLGPVRAMLMDLDPQCHPRGPSDRLRREREAWLQLRAELSAFAFEQGDEFLRPTGRLAVLIDRLLESFASPGPASADEKRQHQEAERLAIDLRTEFQHRARRRGD
jgi:hypothetical protein